MGVLMYFIIGASGSGKTSVLDQIKLPDYTLLDFDDIGVPENADMQWRQSSTEQWLVQILENYDESHTCLFGQMVLGEILACPSAKKLQEINVCFLDCDDVVRVERLQKRANMPINQHTLNWASWLRMHHHDPQWEQHVITGDAIATLDFSSWDRETSWEQLADIYYCDTTHLAINSVSSEIERWIKSLEFSDELVFTKAKKQDLEDIVKLIIDDPLAKTRESYTEDLSAYKHAYRKIIGDQNAYLLVVKSQGNIIAVAQINFIPNLTYQGGTRAQIEGVRVAEAFRHQGIGKKLIQKAIELARERRCCLVQLTTDQQRPEALKFYRGLGFVNSHHGLKLKF